MIIAIDGPSGAGKSTAAKLVSKKLDYLYIDTGAMYRAIALKAYRNNLEICEENMEKILKNTVIDYKDSRILLDSEDVSSLIRDEVISKGASKVSALGNVRRKMVELQRQIAVNKNVVLDGRDIGTTVFPDADYKFFITASLEERANRRFEELKSKGEDVDYGIILSDMKKRDDNDSSREISPLKMADDAILIDTTHMNTQEVVTHIIDCIGGINVL
jgi:cytidylate kinase